MNAMNPKSTYIVSFNTFVLQPVLKEDRMTTGVIERDRLVTVPRKPVHIIRKSCLYYGKSFQTATNSSKLILNKSHKVPIVVAHDFGTPLIFIPTMSATSEHNVWISLHAIENLKGDNMGCTIYFGNDYSIKVNVSEATINRQYTLGSLLQKNFQKKQRQLNGNFHLGSMGPSFQSSKSKQ